ncbi:MAG: acetaldehyde dehydrogenase (acetylating) [Proteobacteria bacterium]|nr:acetaldehyde dehydrogenase (acetylating) [Pseudomonadota bacterium]
MGKLKAVIIGPGNIGTDLLYKAMRSESIDIVWSIGVVETSEGLRIAREHGIKTSHEGLDAVIDEVIADGVQLAFDATSAKYHRHHYEKLAAHGVRMIDLTPAAVGPYCIPPVNLTEHADAPNVNMVTCGGQATIPMVAAVSRVQPVAYGEIVATVASRSIGPGTRNNIDEFTRTTRAGIEAVGGAKKGKAIIVINPADPPILMRDTIHCLTEGEPDQAAITASVHKMVAEVKTYVPGYRLKNGPVFDGNRVTVWVEVEGLGDYLPTYAGNLDIMTAAALKTAEMLAQRGAQ